MITKISQKQREILGVFSVHFIHSVGIFLYAELFLFILPPSHESLFYYIF